jgi:hypothetical protein
MRITPNYTCHECGSAMPYAASECDECRRFVAEEARIRMERAKYGEDAYDERRDAGY